MRYLPFLLLIAVTVFAAIDVALSEDDDERLNVGKIWWVIPIIIFTPIGPIVWFAVSRTIRSRKRNASGAPPAGRYNRAGRGTPAGWHAEQARTATTAPLAPDDDPDFLWGLEQQRRRAEKARRDAEASGADASDGSAASEADDASGSDEPQGEPRP